MFESPMERTDRNDSLSFLSNRAEPSDGKLIGKQSDPESLLRFPALPSLGRNCKRNEDGHESLR